LIESTGRKNLPFTKVQEMKRRKVVYADQGGKPEKEITSGFKTRPISKPRRIRRKKREPVFTERQLELLKARANKYYQMHNSGLRGMSWGGFCDEIFERTHVWIGVEDLRQWATNFKAKRRSTPRHPNDEGFQALASFLMLPDIAMLLPEELNDPEPPYRFLQSFHEFLGVDLNSSSSNSRRSERLNGVYEACLQIEKTDEDEERCVMAILTLEVDHKIGGLRATERSEVRFLGPGEIEVIPDPWIIKGWGIVTPEGDLFLFMNRTSTYYYQTIETPLSPLTLLCHEIPANWGPTSKTLQELIEGITLRKFTKVAELDGNNLAR
jgi:hypothetical protein